ncbi:protein kinase domain-containing protein [Burkholderia pseudomallei]|uniref:protein kinase domain-containing protein n=1 Tax=Burkholderia pseudomallei TaxID=28450 RepID=UPI0021F6BF35|nr:protein kinase [Burkholderia pseudomallei]MCW0024618.1 serine/threonine protein kinase [Burkholderia pseudomallei]MCW0156079.1 serine/threonine protein kinase [Burkholderia pseudomallei]MCW0169493.1 serine/threonine protein kinase [Burkholderia pseudomallei]
MPALADSIVADLTERLCRYLKSSGAYGETVYLASGGSAAVFSVATPQGRRAFKAFNPEFFCGPAGPAERKRLEVQRKLIDHTCPSLIQTFRVDEAEGTAFVEMEFIDWPQLTAALNDIPDDAVVGLFTQLVAAVRFLDAMGIVHRDIKPENIHVSPDFTSLKLLDLGVDREIEQGDAQDVAITDHGNRRPFLATAQYSSPEYLFRLDEPSPKLWKGLNIYQLGAVLHDLIMKRPLFQREVSLGNRWLVARAVLTQTPSFNEDNPTRLAHLKALASRCLVKDIDSRLQLVSWDDFILEGAKDPLTTLRARLAKGTLNVGGQMGVASASRLEFDRTEFFRRFSEMVRTELLSVCGASMHLTLRLSSPVEPPVAHLLFAVDARWTIECSLSFDWLTQMYDRTVNLSLGARLVDAEQNSSEKKESVALVSVATIDENELDVATSVAGEIAKIIGFALDRLESTPASNASKLHNVEIAPNLPEGKNE